MGTTLRRLVGGVRRAVPTMFAASRHEDRLRAGQVGNEHRLMPSRSVSPGKP
jgi:hypothetical protein